MHTLPSRRSHRRQIHLAQRLHTLLAQLDGLPHRSFPVSPGYAGQARRLIAEANRALGTAGPALPESPLSGAEIFPVALLHFDRLNRRIRHEIRASRAASLETYPRPSGPA